MKKNWVVKKLGEVCEIGAGNSAPQKKEMFDDGIYPFFRTSDVGKVHLGFIEDSVDKLNDLGISKLHLYGKGTLLFPKSGASTFLNHRVLMNVDGYVSSHLATLKAQNSILVDRFLLYFSMTVDSRNLMQDQNYPSLRLSDIQEINILLPPIPEQQRIVAILDDAFAAIATAKENAEKNLKNAREIFESYLQSVFANPGDGWKKKLLGDVCDFVRGPFGGSLKKSIFVDDGFAVYEQSHAIYDQFDEVRYFIDEKKFKEMQRFELKPNDLIMSCSGTMGKVSIVPTNIRRGIINQALLKLTPSEQISNFFLKYWMESGDFQKGLKAYSMGAAIQNVASVKVLKGIRVPIPPIKEQLNIVAKLDALSTETKKLEATYRQKLADVDELKKSVLQKAFNGELAGAHP